MHPVRALCFAGAIAYVCSVVPAAATTINLNSGTSGTNTGAPQSFNETRGVDVTVQGASDLSLTSMTLHGLYIGLASGSLGARVYDSGTHALLASADVAVPVAANQTVAVPITAVLQAGHSYRLSFFVSDGGVGGSGTMFDPAPAGLGGFPYTESSGKLLINQAYSTATDNFPSSQNIYVPLISLDVISTDIDLTSGTTGVLVFSQSFDETRGLDVTVQGGTDLGLSAMTLRGLNIAFAGGIPGARVYDSGTQALLSSVTVPVPVGNNQTVTVAIAAALKAGKSYRTCFFVYDPGGGGTGTFFDPTPSGSGGIPYTESSGLLLVNQCYSTLVDAFPNLVNYLVPRITLKVAAGLAAVGPDSPALGWEVGAVSPNPGTRGAIDFELPTRSRVVMGLYSAAGRRLRQSEWMLEQGRHSEPAYTGEVPAGIYYIRLTAYPQSGGAAHRAARRFVVLGG